MNSFFTTIQEHAALISGAAAAVGSVWLSKTKLWKAGKSIHSFATAPQRTEQATTEIREILTGFIAEKRESDAKRDERAKQIELKVCRVEKALFNGGRNGVIHNIDLLKAQCHGNFETSPCPMFVCDEEGANAQVNAAYRKLVQVWSSHDISGTQWQQALHGPHKENYIKEFQARAASGEDFVGDCDFKNPFTNEHRGRWKISAPSTAKTDGGMIYIGSFIAALDETAVEIAEQEGWAVMDLTNETT